MNKKLLPILACPICKSKLQYNVANQELICHVDKLVFKINNGVPNMIVDQSYKLKE